MSADQNLYSPPRADLNRAIGAPKARPVWAILIGYVLNTIGRLMPSLFAKLGLYDLLGHTFSISDDQMHSIMIAISLGSRWLMAVLAAYTCTRMAWGYEIRCLVALIVFTFTYPVLFNLLGPGLRWTILFAAANSGILACMLVGARFGRRINQKLESAQGLFS